MTVVSCSGVQALLAGPALTFSQILSCPNTPVASAHLHVLGGLLKSALRPVLGRLRLGAGLGRSPLQLALRLRLCALSGALCLRCGALRQAEIRMGNSTSYQKKYAPSARGSQSVCISCCQKHGCMRWQLLELSASTGSCSSLWAGIQNQLITVQLPRTRAAMHCAPCPCQWPGPPWPAPCGWPR